MKLSPEQTRVLDILGDDTASAYGLGCKVSTLWALQRRGLVAIKRELGNMAFPHNAQWSITPAGRRALATSKGGPHDASK